MPLTFSYFIPVQPFRRASFLSPPAQDHKLMADYIIPVLNQQHDFAMTTAERQMPAHPFFTVFLPTTTFSTNASFQLKTLLKF